MNDAFEFDVPATCAHLGPGFGVLAVALDLPMRISVQPSSPTGHSVERRGTAKDMHLDPRHDSILRGLAAAAERFDIKVPSSLAIAADSQVPPASGLGTQTAGFAAGVGIAARFARKRLPVHELLDLLVELGGDPGHGAAALAGGLCAACQTSPPAAPLRFRAVPHPLHASWRFVVVVPALHIPTADTRRILPPTLPHAVAPRTAGRLVGLLRALAEGDAEGLRAFMVDEVHVPYRRRLVPGIDAAIAAGREAGAAGVTIAGHGPALVALTTADSACDDIAAAMASAFAAAGQRAETMTLAATADGALRNGA